MLIIQTKPNSYNSNVKIQKKKQKLAGLGFNGELSLKLAANLAPRTKKASAELDRRKRAALALRHLNWRS